MKLLGILIIINSLVVAGYWVSGTHQHKVGVISVCVLAVFVGVIFTMHDRAIEITFNKIGTIKAAAEQATADANEVAAIKERIEAQSATVDLVAESAAKAHNLIEDLSRKNKTAETKIEELENAGAAIQKTISALQETAEFTSLVAAAQNDDRATFDKLVSWVDNKTSPYWQHAADAVARIRTDFAGQIERGHMNVPWPEGTDPRQLSLAQLKREYQGAVRVYKADLAQTVWKSSVIDEEGQDVLLRRHLKR